MSESERKCPACSAPLKPGAKYCPSCGERIQPVLRDGGNAAPPGAQPSADEGAASRPASAPAAPFDLAVARPEAMQVGRRANVRIRFTPRTDLYKSVAFVCRCDARELAKGAFGSCSEAGIQKEKDIAIIPELFGDARLSFDLFCRFEMDGMCGEEVYTAAFSLPVDPRHEAPNIQFGGINIAPNMTATGAADGRIDIGGVHVNLGGQDSARRGDEARYKTGDSFTPLQSRLVKSPPRLTLESGGEVVQLLSDETVTFGRSRDTTVPLRICGPDGRVDVELNRKGDTAFLSSFQFALKRSEDRCVLFDGNIDTGKDSNGVCVDGVALPPKGKKRLDAGRETVLDVGFPGHGLELRVTPHQDARGGAAGFILDRCDGARQRVFAVWKSLPAGDGARVSWDGESWRLLRNGTAIPLAAGTDVSIGGRTFNVQPFHKTHLH